MYIPILSEGTVVDNNFMVHAASWLVVEIQHLGRDNVAIMEDIEMDDDAVPGAAFIC